jgi:bifunctional polynucleotide phosphatase/kinase
LRAEKAVANFFKPASQKEPEKITWRIVGGTLLIGKYRPSEGTSKPLQGKRKIAALDFVCHY